MGSKPTNWLAFDEKENEPLVDVIAGVADFSDDQIDEFNNMTTELDRINGKQRQNLYMWFVSTRKIGYRLPGNVVLQFLNHTINNFNHKAD